MKKYVKPETIVKDVVLTSMIASSPGLDLKDVPAGQEYEALTKGRDVWKDGFWD